MSDGDGLICAYALDGAGGGRPLTWDAIEAWEPSAGVLWVHLDRTGEKARTWLEQSSGIDPVIQSVLLMEEVRPRSLQSEDALLVILRGVNLNPGAEPEDMVGVRLWIEPQRIITVRHRRLMAVNDIREKLDSGHGPSAPGDFLVQIADRLIDRMGPVLSDLDDSVDQLEDEVLTAESAQLRTRLSGLRREAITLRRYLAPQRDVMARLQMEQVSWLDAAERVKLREIADRITRYVEDLDSARERAAVTQDELNSRLSDQMNRTMYLLTVVAAVLLPPSLLTGLLGINVGGLPGVESPWAFYLVLALIMLMAPLEIWVLRRLRWI